MQTKKKVSVSDVLASKNQERLSVLTAYDYSTATICDKAGVDILLVGDSASMVVLGYSSTVPIGMTEMQIFCNAVARGAKRAMVVGDMPFGSYQPSASRAIKNAVRLVKAGCDAVKLEGGEEVAETVRAIVDSGIPVMGHIGLKPQTSSLWEGYKVQGRTANSALKLMRDAKALQAAGAFSIVLEMVASEVAAEISKSLDIPTVGIGSGTGCDGQVLVLHDMLGIYEDIKPKFVKRYAELAGVISEAVSRYSRDVKAGKFPEEPNIFHMDAEESRRFKEVARKDKHE
jgi:3-methyl-2-oxobutanoate hydroxymethyltransferase